MDAALPAFGADANTQACAVDLALPGVLPVLNKKAVECAIRFGLAIGAEVAAKSVFARKNYFYPDLPKGYQISQFELPVVVGGRISFPVGSGEKAYEKQVQLTTEDARALVDGILDVSFHLGDPRTVDQGPLSGRHAGRRADDQDRTAGAGAVGKELPQVLLAIFFLGRTPLRLCAG